MTVERWLAVGLSLFLVLIYAFGSLYLVDNSSNWYSTLRKPKWQPPDWVFGVIWPYNFLLLALAFVTASVKASLHDVWLMLCLFAVSVFAALAWSYYFYRPRALEKAAAWLVAAALFTVPVMLLVAQTTSLIGWLLPYQLWLVIAASLSIGYAKLNRS